MRVIVMRIKYHSIYMQEDLDTKEWGEIGWLAKHRKAKKYFLGGYRNEVRKSNGTFGTQQGETLIGRKAWRKARFD